MLVYKLKLKSITIFLKNNYLFIVKIDQLHKQCIFQTLCSGEGRGFGYFDKLKNLNWLSNNFLLPCITTEENFIIRPTFILI